MPDRYEFLSSKHPVFEAWTRGAPIARRGPQGLEDRPVTFEEQLQYSRDSHSGFTYGAWLRNEIRLRGGDEVLAELRRFDWELMSGEHYRSRQAQATYVNFPDMYVTAVLGHLLREAPTANENLNFGNMGEVNLEETPAEPSQADQIYYNADGVGNDGSQWANFWLGVMRRAFATGHRWMMVEAPQDRPATRRDELRGLRPYLVEWSPTRVPNWHYEAGRLDFAIVRPSRRRPRLEGGELKGNKPESGYLLLVRKGFDGFGQEFAGGGWWEFDADQRPTDAKGTWEKTGGEIPFFPVFHERDEGSEFRPAISRPGVTELGQVAVSYLNLSSAADFDAWDAAVSMQFVMGADEEGFNLAMRKIAEGSRWAPVPANQTTGETPSVHDGSLGAVVADVFEKRLAQKREEAREISAREATSTPDSSGRSKEAGFTEQKAPRLALLAGELEQAQNTAIHFLEQRFGHQRPSGFVRWPREFDLAPLIEEIAGMFELELRTGYRSPTLGAAMMTRAAVERGQVPDDATRATVQAEYKEAAEKAAEKAAQLSDLEREGGFGGLFGGGPLE